MCDPDFSEEQLHTLRRAVGARLSSYRFVHTCGVEKEATALAALYCPEKASLLAAAALLHDITKEYNEEAQRAMMREAGITLRPDETAAVGIFHSITGPIVIARDFPDFAVPELLSAVRWHTTGRAGMTVPDALLFLSDLTEPGRNFAECVELRRMLWQADMQNMTRTERLSHLRDVMLAAYDSLQKRLTAAHLPLSLDTAAAAADLKQQKYPFERNEL